MSEDNVTHTNPLIISVVLGAMLFTTVGNVVAAWKLTSMQRAVSQTFCIQAD